MKYVIIILFIFLIRGVSAQIMSINQLIKMHNQNPSEFEDYMFSLKYELDIHRDLSDIHSTYGYINTSSKTGNIYLVKYFLDDKGINDSLVLKTTSQKQYLDLKNSLLKNKFRYVNSTAKIEYVYYHYESDLYKIVFEIDTSLEDIYYTISLSNKS